MKKSTILAIALAVSMSGFTSAFATERSDSNYDTVAKTDASGNATYLHPSAKWDGAYFPRDSEVSAQYGDPVITGLITKDESATGLAAGVTKWNVDGGGVVYSTEVDGHTVFNLNPFSTDTMKTGVTLPAMELPKDYNVNISRIQQYYQMDYTATLTAFEAENRINADNKLHLDDVKSIGMSIDTSGNITTDLTFNDASTISASVGIGEYVKLNAGNAYYYDGPITINEAIKNNADKIAINTNNIATNTTNIANNTTNIANNATQIANNTANITKNTNDITQIKQNVATNTTNIANNATEINNIKNNNVTNVTKDGDTLTITQTVDGTTETVEFKDKHITGMNQSLGDYSSTDGTKGKLTTTITTNFGDPYTETVNIGGYVSDAIKAEAAGGNVTVNGTTTTIQEAINNNYSQIQQNTTNITNNTNAINNLTQNVTNNTNNIAQNTTEINTIKNNYVTNIDKQGDKIIVNQNVNGNNQTQEFTDWHINGMTQNMGDYSSTDGTKGQLTTQITTNFGETYTQTVDIGGYVSDAIKAEAKDGNVTVGGTTTTIEQAINKNYTEINNIKTDITEITDNNVTNVTKNGDTLTITQTVNGQTQVVDFTDKHINEIQQSIGAYGTDNAGKLTTIIKDNVGNSYSSTTDISGYVSDSIYNEAAGGKLTINGSDTTIGDQIKQNVTNIQQNTEKINKGWNAQIDGTQVNNVQLGGALNFESGKNIQLSAGENGSIVVNTKDDVEFNSVKADSVTTNSLTTKSITVGKTVIDEKQVSINNKITNVHAGEVSETSTDAVNGSQLYQTNQRVTNLEGNVAKLGSRVNKVGANAAALAALHPMDFDPDDKLSFAAGAGNYGGENAMAIGMFYRPSEKVMLSAGGSMGNGENMVNMGVAFALDRPNVSNTKVAMAKEIIDLREHIDRQDQQISQLMTAVSTLTGQVIDNRGKDFFPDVPENHWAYEYIKGLFDEGIIEGYPDGMFSGERTATRYEFAAMLYRALKKGVNLDSRIMSEFQPELSRIRVDRIYGDICDRDKVERVRVNLSKDTDHYGSKCK